MPFLRVEKKKSGTYIRIIESYRNAEGKASHRILFSLGRVEDYTPEQLRSIGIKLYELGGGEIKALLNDDISEVGRYNYGYQYVYKKILKEYKLDEVFTRIVKRSKIEFDFANAVTLMLIERLQDPTSKRSNYLHQCEYLDLPQIGLHHLYRALDKLADNSEYIQKQIFQKGRDLFNSRIDVVFYDVTTFYFESEEEKENELRQMGYGKDGKIGHTQILFSMMIDANKNPIGYRIFKGNTFEGDTFEKALEDLKKTYNIDKVIVVADRGMLSKKNIALTQSNGYEFIIGERLKSLPKNIKESLIDLTHYKSEWIYTDHEGSQVCLKYTTLELGDKTIICTYSDNRAKKDKLEREEKVKKAEILIKQPSKLKGKQKRHFIKQTKEEAYEIDQSKIEYSEKFDGFLAISTNTQISITQVLENYKQLYKIEHSFRTFKSHLETRPMFHWTDKRIEGHICLCYIAFTIQNYILQKINNNKVKISEKSLRESLNKMQVSLIEKGNQSFYLRSAPTPNEVIILNQLGLKPLLPIIKRELMSIG
jgi:transposase